MLSHVDELMALGADEPLLTVLSYGMGQDSTAILFRLLNDTSARHRYAPARLIVVASDTGNEHDHTYEYVEKARSACEVAGVPFFFLSAGGEFHSDAWASLTAQWERNDTVGFKAGFKSCTDNLKIAPFYRFLARYVCETFRIYKHGSAAIEIFAQYYGRARVLIGFASDEQDRQAKDESRPVWHRSAIEMAYPLIDWGWTRKDCVDYLGRLGAPVPYPSNCKFCPYSTELDVLWLWQNEPAEFERWQEYERRKLVKFKSRPGTNKTVFGTKTLAEVLAIAREKYAQLTAEEVTRLKFERGHCVRSKY
jgi:3'-phosphoadenosine 5'-phosphosulfate sulfotransferase (PAPS reductase)/FAD synthetase